MLEDIYQSFLEYNSKVIGSRYEDLNLNEIHSIDFIGKNEFPNVTRIASHLRITKGAVTKMLAKLRRFGYVEMFREDTNKKEKYFRLTRKGKQLFSRHEAIHKDTLEHYKRMYNQFSPAELETVYSFLGVIQKELDDKLKTN
jgi:DNA-binding MarR family transcriptional regulator